MEEKETDNRTLGQIFVDIHRVVKSAESDEKVDLEKNIAQSVDLKSKVDSLKESFWHFSEIWGYFQSGNLS